MIPLSIFLLSSGSLNIPESEYQSVHQEHSIAPAVSAFDLNENIRTVFHKISDGALYLGAGTMLGSASLLTGLGWGLSQISPWASTLGNECFLLSHLFGCTARHFFAQVLKGTSSLPSFFGKIPISHYSWQQNQKELSQIPAFSDDEKQLLLFLEKRWLAKSTGFYSTLIDWICPCFGIFVQVHPETTNSYARDPWNKLSQTYKNRMENWKLSLPHPQHYPLILTRPANLQDYLPAYLSTALEEDVRSTTQKLTLKVPTIGRKIILDLTGALPSRTQTRKKWLEDWEDYQAQLFQTCKELHLNPNEILCIQRVSQGHIGGIRLLPFRDTSQAEIDQDYQFLLEWISKFGMSANRVELDRYPPTSYASQSFHKEPSPISSESLSKDELLMHLDHFENDWNSNHPQKTLMVKGALQTIRGLITTLSEDKWEEIMSCRTQSSVALLCFSRIKDLLKHLAKEKDQVPFFDTVSNIELIHANLCCLLEIFNPFHPEDFPPIFENLLTSIPTDLKTLTSYGIHSSGMTSLAGIFKAVEKTVGGPIRVLYGENTYFENIFAAEKVANASLIDEATENDWKEVDLILGQFNPVLKRIDFEVTEYRVERIRETLHLALNARKGKPLTLALDCTLDYIDSPRVAKLLAEFDREIQMGKLNIVFYRSGLKFDLFGMDNYCGAPFYMIHNQDPKWDHFKALVIDPVLQTDRLSFNWFCLAYKSAAPLLELYRKQVFDNTWALLNRVPARLLNNKNVDYRIIPVEPDADPGFIDIKVFGHLHEIRGGLLVGGLLTVKCMEGGQPIFYRPSIGFYHPNLSILFGDDCTTIRLTLGIDPAQIDLLTKCFEMIDALNGTPSQKLLEKVQITLLKD